MFPGSKLPDLKIITEFPHEFDVLDTVWIPMPDGKRLAARIWRPKIAFEQPVPAVLEMIPYRRRDGRLADDERIHPYFAGHGIAGVRVDIRGSGDSEGLLEDEYLALEQDDACAVIAWLADQPWCNGSVGMMGLSWGGFNSLQTAARRPAALKAIIAIGATVDRYNDDVHYKNGCLVNENVGWGTSFMSFCSRPPDPAVVGDAWRDIWFERLENLPFLPAKWLSHQTKDAYWKHGSVSEDYSAIQCPVMIVTGWADAYMNAVPRLLENLQVPCKAIAGAWAHQVPHIADPGPTLDFLHEATEWWRTWLTGEGNVADESPNYLAFQQFSTRRVFIRDRVIPGRWITTKWTSAPSTGQTFFLGENGLTQAETACPEKTFRSRVDLGLKAGEFIPHCVGQELADDQKKDDEGSVTFDSPVLTEPVDLWGDAEFTVTLKCDRPTGNLFVRLCDVDARGSSRRVTFGVLNLTHRNGNERPEPMPVNEPVTISIKLNHMSHQFKAGHRVRLALSTAYFPMFWPARDNPTLTLTAEPSRLFLPIPEKFDVVEVNGPVAPKPANMRLLRSPSSSRQSMQNPTVRETTLSIDDGYGAVEYVDNGMINSGLKRERYEINWDDHHSAVQTLHWTQELKRGNWYVRTETHGQFWSDDEYYFIEVEIDAFEGNELVWQRSWKDKVARQS